MKIKFILLILIPLIFIFYSCSENNVSNDDKVYIFGFEAYRLVIKEAGNAMSQGCGDVCSKYFISAAEREDFRKFYPQYIEFQKYIDPRFNSGFWKRVMK